MVYFGRIQNVEVVVCSNCCKRGTVARRLVVYEMDGREGNIGDALKEIRVIVELKENMPRSGKKWDSITLFVSYVIGMIGRGERDKLR